MDRVQTFDGGISQVVLLVSLKMVVWPYWDIRIQNS